MPPALPPTARWPAWAAAFCALSAAFCAHGQAPAPAPDTGPAATKPIKTTLAYAPVVTLDGRKAVNACGVQITVLRDEEPLVAGELVVTREGEGTRTTWCSAPRARHLAKPTTGKAILEVRGAQRLEAPIALPSAAPSAGCTTLENPSSLLFQRLLVGGGTLRIAREGRPTLSITLPRPLPGALSRAYLQCAGDLFRPEDAADGT